MLCRQQYDRDVADTDVALQNLAEFITVHFRHHNVADNDVRLVVAGLFQGFRTIACRIYALEFVLQRFCNEGAYFLLVIHNQQRKGRHVEIVVEVASLVVIL